MSAPNEQAEAGFAETIAAAATRLATSVQRKHRNEKIQPQFVMQPGWRKCQQIDGRRSHLIAMDTNEPRAVFLLMAQHPGVCGAIADVGVPAISAGFIGMGAIAAVETHAVVVGAVRTRRA